MHLPRRYQLYVGVWVLCYGYAIGHLIYAVAFHDQTALVHVPRGPVIALVFTMVFTGVEFNLARYQIAQRYGWDYVGTGTSLPARLIRDADAHQHAYLVAFRRSVTVLLVMMIASLFACVIAFAGLAIMQANIGSP